jgi:hypothetical protein
MTEKLSFKDKIAALFCVCLGVLNFTAWMIAIFIAFFGNTYARIILLILLIYQFLFAKRRESYRQLLRTMKAYNYFKSYNLHLEEEPKPSHCLFSFHPHGVMSVGVTLAFSINEFFYKTSFCVSRALTYVPLSGLFARLMGVEGVDNKTFETLMDQGKNISFLPGGFEEATLTANDEERVFIKNRKGFIKYALKYGYSVYPCYTFGENNLFMTFTRWEKLRLLFNKIKLPGVLFISKYLWLPSNEVDLYTVVGKPIDLPKIEKPTSEEVDKYHSIYIQELSSVFNRHKNGRVKKDILEIT